MEISQILFNMVKAFLQLVYIYMVLMNITKCTFKLLKCMYTFLRVSHFLIDNAIHFTTLDLDICVHVKINKILMRVIQYIKT